MCIGVWFYWKDKEVVGDLWVCFGCGFEGEE